MDARLRIDHIPAVNCLTGGIYQPAATLIHLVPLRSKPRTVALPNNTLLPKNSQVCPIIPLAV